MTVNELIQKLQELSEQGFGNYTVEISVYDPGCIIDGDGWTGFDFDEAYEIDWNTDMGIVEFIQRKD